MSLTSTLMTRAIMQQLSNVQAAVVPGIEQYIIEPVATVEDPADPVEDPADPVEDPADPVEEQDTRPIAIARSTPAGKRIMKYLATPGNAADGHSSEIQSRRRVLAKIAYLIGIGELSRGDWMYEAANYFRIRQIMHGALDGNSKDPVYRSRMARCGIKTQAQFDACGEVLRKMGNLKDGSVMAGMVMTESDIMELVRDTKHITGR